jgi:hypothetical protein
VIGFELPAAPMVDDGEPGLEAVGLVARKLADGVVFAVPPPPPPTAATLHINA